MAGGVSHCVRTYLLLNRGWCGFGIELISWEELTILCIFFSFIFVHCLSTTLSRGAQRRKGTIEHAGEKQCGLVFFVFFLFFVEVTTKSEAQILGIGSASGWIEWFIGMCCGCCTKATNLNNKQTFFVWKFNKKNNIWLEIYYIYSIVSIWVRETQLYFNCFSFFCC